MRRSSSSLHKLGSRNTALHSHHVAAIYASNEEKAPVSRTGQRCIIEVTRYTSWYRNALVHQTPYSYYDSLLDHAYISAGCSTASAPPTFLFSIMRIFTVYLSSCSRPSVNLGVATHNRCSANDDTEAQRQACDVESAPNERRSLRGSGDVRDGVGNADS